MPIASFQEHSKNGPLIAYHQSGELRNYLDIPEFATLPSDSLRIGLKLEKQKREKGRYLLSHHYQQTKIRTEEI